MQLNPIEKAGILRALSRAIEIAGQDESNADPLRTARAFIDAMPAHSPCRLCLDFNAGYCARWKQEIPPEWLEKGCDQWIDDVPF